MSITGKKLVKFTSRIMMLLVLAATLLAGPAGAQDEQPPSALFKKFVNSADGETNTHTPPQASFTAYLNRDQSRVLTETAPRWQEGTDPNINGQGSVALQAGNFPELEVGDSLFLRFTDVALNQQGVATAEVDELPWENEDFFFALTLEETDLPPRPQNVQVTVQENGERTISWQGEEGLTYDVYRRDREDAIFDGRQRMLYERVAQDVSGANYIDAPPEGSYAYIVYARNAEGVVGPHSEEAVERLQVEGLTAEAGLTNVTLDWEAFDTPVGSTAGYQVYRRQEGATYGDPLSVTGTRDAGGGTRFVDSKLEPGTTYYYVVRARNDRRREFGESDEVAVTTLESASDRYTYANLKAAVVIYLNTNEAPNNEDGAPEQFSAAEGEDIKKLLEYTRLFYWRQSGMKLNLEYTFYVIDEYKEFDRGAWVSAEQTVGHLRDDYGVLAGQYDLIFRTNPANTGFWSIGVPQSGLGMVDIHGDPVAERIVGFAQTHWPKYTGAGYPFVFDDIDTPPGVIWTAEHEMQHVIDAIYRWNGHEEMPHGDFPWEFDAVPVGGHWDFQRGMFNTFDAYEDLNAQWGDLYETTDADGDGFPDADPRVPLNENDFGSSTEAVDTDSDGYTDKQEATDGIFHYSVTDPHDPDTDGDGAPDGEDPYPRYPVTPEIARFTPEIDGTIEEDWPLVNDTVSYTSVSGGYAPKLYMSYDDENFYFALDLSTVVTQPLIKFDFGGDGWQHGAGNTEIEIDLWNEQFDTFHSWDGTPEVRAYDQQVNDRKVGRPMWDHTSKYQDEFNRRVIHPAVVALAVDKDHPHYQVEMSIPRNEYAQLTLEPGDRIGLSVDYGDSDLQDRGFAKTFDDYSLVYLTLATATDAEEPIGEAPGSLDLAPGYPNPFQSSSTVAYELPQPSDVQLAVYDVLGRQVAVLVEGRQSAGRHEVEWDGRDAAGHPAPAGVYFYRLQTDEGRQRTQAVTRIR